jgi:hypothetical protein
MNGSDEQTMFATLLVAERVAELLVATAVFVALKRLKVFFV